MYECGYERLLKRMEWGIVVFFVFTAVSGIIGGIVKHIRLRLGIRYGDEEETDGS